MKTNTKTKIALFTLICIVTAILFSSSYFNNSFFKSSGSSNVSTVPPNQLPTNISVTVEKKNDSVAIIEKKPVATVYPTVYVAPHFHVPMPNSNVDIEFATAPTPSPTPSPLPISDLSDPYQNSSFPLTVNVSSLTLGNITALYRTTENVFAYQGIASDDQYYYTSYSDSLYKWNYNWTLLTSNYVLDDLPGVVDNVSLGSQINSLYVKDDLIYAGVLNCSFLYDGQAGFHGGSWIAVFNCSDLNFVAMYPVEDEFTEGCSFHDGFWWVTYQSPLVEFSNISKYDADWNFVCDYVLSYPQVGFGDVGYQGVRWIGDYLYANIHEGQLTAYLDVYYWNASASIFVPVERIQQPSAYTTQGFEVDSANKLIYWAERSFNGTRIYGSDCRVLVTSYSG